MTDPVPIKYKCAAVVTSLPDGRRYVLVSLTLTCPVCGEIEMQIPGHHLRTVVELLREKLIEYHDLTTPARVTDDLRDLLAMQGELLGEKETKH